MSGGYNYKPSQKGYISLIKKRCQLVDEDRAALEVAKELECFVTKNKPIVKIPVEKGYILTSRPNFWK